MSVTNEAADRSQPDVNDPLTGIYTIDDFLRIRAEEEPQVPILAYPRSELGLLDYDHFTARDLDRFGGNVARILTARGLHVKNDGSKTPIVALLGPSNLAYLSTIFGLTRLGYGILLLSTRLAVPAYAALLKACDCSTIITSESFIKIFPDLNTLLDNNLKIFLFPTRQEFESDHGTTDRNAIPISPSSSSSVAFIIHSSGSTGVPKPIFQLHKTALPNYLNGFNARLFVSLPLYHNHGLCNFFRSLWSRKEMIMFNANLPLTGEGLMKVIEKEKPRVVSAVPYALKLIAQWEGGVQALRECDVVTFGGSACPDELGDLLTKEEVHLVGHYGATEVGQLMTSTRPRSDKAWNYLRLESAAIPYMNMQELAPGTYECVVLDGWRSKTISNSNDPPNSFRTRDLFSKHSTIPHAWKYIGRLDDRVTLMNGEKVLPLSMEGKIRQHPLIKEVVVFGAGKILPGLLVFRADAAKELEDDDFINAIWSLVEDANRSAEAFARIERGMIIALPAGAKYPVTDKGTFIRARVYKDFAKPIEDAYQRFESGANGVAKLCLDLAGLEDWIMKTFKDEIGIALTSTDQLFFAAGVDSLQAIRMWSLIRREIDLGGGADRVSQNAVFEMQNVKMLAGFLYAVRTGSTADGKNQVDVMRELEEKYSEFEEFEPVSKEGSGAKVLLLTGATGSLGAHVLAQALNIDSISNIYCLVRASDPQAAKQRILTSLDERSLLVPADLGSKVICLPSDLSKPDLGLDSSVLSHIKETVTHILHIAWAVNFNLGVESFEDQHIRGTYNLINLSLSVSQPKPARFFFCSSISVAVGSPRPATIHEAPVPDLSHAQDMGYARSKLITERITVAAAKNAGARSRVLRVGQVVGDGNAGIWNDTEAIPLMVRSALVLKSLPRLGERPSWIPVDILAKSMLEVSGLSQADDVPETRDAEPELVYHLLNPLTFSWDEDFLPALRRAGLKFEDVEWKTWFQKLKGVEQDPVQNPAVRLIPFWQKKYGDVGNGAGDPEIKAGGIKFATQITEMDSETLRGGIDLIREGYVEKFVYAWLRKWKQGSNAVLA